VSKVDSSLCATSSHKGKSLLVDFLLNSNYMCLVKTRLNCILPTNCVAMRSRCFTCIVFALCSFLWGGSVLVAQESPVPTGTPVVIEKPSLLSISGVLEICKGSETILKAEGNFESFQWEKEGVSGRILRVKEEGLYEVTAKTKAGCTFTASVNVRVRPCSLP
jgi:hypothetical protein